MPSYKVDDDQNPRLDLFLGEKIPVLSRSYIQKLCNEGRALVNGESCKPGYRLKQGDLIKLNYDISKLPGPPDINIPILYEDDDCIVINKPAGLLSHSNTTLTTEPSVASFIRQHSLSIDGERAGIVHRLDRQTSGVMICAKNTNSMKILQKQFSSRKVSKTYIAVTSGLLEKKEAIIEMPIGRNPKKPGMFEALNSGKEAVTYYKVLDESGRHSLISLEPKTGRTHQLRIHLSKIGHPIVGDVLYGGEQAERLFLHSNSLKIRLPNGKSAEFKAKTPDQFYNFLKNDK